MRTSRGVIAFAAGCLVATATGAAAPAAATPAAGGCAPSWKLAATPAPPGDQTTLSGPTVISAKDAWFPGSSFTGGVVAEHPWVLHWDGHSLSATGTVPQGPFETRHGGTGSFDSATDGWILGYSTLLPVAYPDYAARWYGGHWTITPLAVSPDPTTQTPGLASVASISPTDAWAVGDSYKGFQLLGALIEHWDGTQWSIVPNPLSGQPGAALRGITVISPSDIWAVGQQQNASGVTVPLAEHWDGTSWSVVPAPAGNSPSALYSVSADSQGGIWAVGAQTDPSTGTARGLAEHWNGTAWTVATGLPPLSGNSEHPSNELTSVYAASPTDVWATIFSVLPNTDLGYQNFLHWDGTNWTLVPVPGPQEYNLDYEYSGIAGTGPDNIWAAGYSIHEPSGTDTPLIAHLSCG